jgi:hypothetical protein
VTGHARREGAEVVDGTGVLVLALGALVAASVLYGRRRILQRKRESLQRLLAREPSLVLTDAPCGLGAATLPHRFVGVPAGDRRCGVRWGVAGPLDVTVFGAARSLECAAFQWWWEERRSQRTQHGTRTTYVQKRTTVALLRLPVRVDEPIVLRPESALGRVGLTRGGHQLESSEFNRRFRVECQDRTLTLHLLDARLQDLLTSSFAGRTLELRGDLLALVGSPAHRDASLQGVVGELPAVRQDVARVAGAIPGPYWRALGAPDP